MDDSTTSVFQFVRCTDVFAQGTVPDGDEVAVEREDDTVDGRIDPCSSALDALFMDDDFVPVREGTD